MLQKCSLPNTATSKLMDFGMVQITVIIIVILVPGICLLTARFSSKWFVLFFFMKGIANRIPHNLKDITEACV